MGYNVEVFKVFIGSLRKSGFRGHIILGVAENVSPDVLAYMRSQGATPKVLAKADCTFAQNGMEVIGWELRKRRKEHIGGLP